MWLKGAAEILSWTSNNSNGKVVNHGESFFVVDKDSEGRGYFDGLSCAADAVCCDDLGNLAGDWGAEKQPRYEAGCAVPVSEHKRDPFKRVAGGADRAPPDDSRRWQRGDHENLRRWMSLGGS